jgi:hypothetical protein
MLMLAFPVSAIAPISQRLLDCLTSMPLRNLQLDKRTPA